MLYYSSVSMFVNPSKATVMGRTLVASGLPGAVVIMHSLEHSQGHMSRSNSFWVFEGEPDSEVAHPEGGAAEFSEELV